MKLRKAENKKIEYEKKYLKKMLENKFRQRKWKLKVNFDQKIGIPVWTGLDISNIHVCSIEYFYTDLEINHSFIQAQPKPQLKLG